ncbi:MAG: HAD hydrolase family protein [Candidatus Bathyarchaeota archaeon]|nr:HAD hydrolase family protein [Candidatus Bathyarchaeota archaeon]
MRRIFISDCEGPISKNDNAFEITKHFVPKGAKLFTLISKYDDVLADFLKKPGYNAGSTLKLILPFLKAYDVTEKDIEQFSAETLLLLADSKFTLSYIQKIAPAFIISTSYEQYIKVLCEALNFPYENTYCTKLSIDNFAITEKEKKDLKEIVHELTDLPPIKIPQKAKNLNDFSEETQKIIRRLDTIFWKDISNSHLSHFLSDIIPIGGHQKAEAIKDVIRRMNTSIENVIYFGDSITDIEALSLVSEKGGLAVSFNGNQYAVKNSEVAVMSNSNLISALITDLFCKSGREKTMKILKNWSAKTLKKSGLNEHLLSLFLNTYRENLPKVQILTPENTDLLIRESNAFRKSIRGEAVGRLG